MMISRGTYGVVNSFRPVTAGTSQHERCCTTQIMGYHVVMQHVYSHQRGVEEPGNTVP